MQELKAFACLVLAAVYFFEVVISWCPQGWYGWRESCYMPLNNSLSWDDASEKCRGEGGLLLVENSQEEYVIATKLRDKWFSEHTSKPLWIGCEVYQRSMHCLGGKGNGSGVFVTWGDIVKPIDQTYGRKCVRKGGLQWGILYTVDCSERNFVICEKPGIPVYCASLGADGRVAQRCLHGHDIKSLTVKGVGECGQACWAEPQCRSFNLCHGGPEKMCQLNNVQRTDVSEDYFNEQDGCIYFDV